MKTARMALLCAAMALSCSDEKSVVVIAVYGGVVPVTGVAQLRVQATTGQSGEYSQVLFYPETPRAEPPGVVLHDETNSERWPERVSRRIAPRLNTSLRSSTRK